MEDVVRTARRGVVIFVATASAAFGLVMIWFLVRPGVISHVATLQMMVVLGLFLLPVATLATWVMDRHAITEEPARDQPEITRSTDADTTVARGHTAHTPARADHDDPRRPPAPHRHRKPAPAGDRVC